jgi:hypothetical protein
LADRKERLAKVLARAGKAIQFNERLAHDSRPACEAACCLGLHRLQVDSPYRNGVSKTGFSRKTLRAKPSGAKALELGTVEGRQ